MNIPFKYKVLLWAVGLLVGFPTSYQGYVWYQTKHAKQLSNCVTDMYQADYSSEQAIKAAEAQLTACRQGVDPHKGTIQFIKEEAKRARQ